MKHSDYLKKKKTRETRKKIISVISAIVVFITTYALVLPAITLDVSRASREPGIAYEQMQFKATASAASVTAADSTVEEAQVEEPAAEEAAEEETIKEGAAEIPEEETSAVSDENEKEEAEQVVEEAPAESAREEAPAAEAEEVQEEEDKSAEEKADAEPSSEPAQEEAQTAETQKSADQAVVDQSGKSGTQATEAAAAASTEETAAEFQIPTLDPIDFDEILTGKTDFYFYHVEKTEEDENITSDSVDDWKKVGSDTVLAPEDFVRVYLSYEIPAGSLNETNAEARYRLPAGLELSDKQIKDINKYENGIAASKSGREHDKYLGAEAIEGSRTPDEKAGEEYISATVKAEKVYKDGEYVGQDLIFTFIPYTVEKNQISYDEAGKLTSEGRNVKGFFTFDLTTAQIDFEKTEKETVEKEDGTKEEIQYSRAEVVFVKENNKKNIDEISRILTMAGPFEKEEPQVQEPKTLISKGEGNDYTVTVSYTDDAQIPDNAELAVREIEKDTDEYASYLEQAKGAVDENKSVNEARFFDITIVADGEKIEPQAPVNVQITFTGIEQTNTDDTQLLHYKDDKEVEVMDQAEFSKSEEPENETKAVDTVQFETDGFSVYGIVGTETITVPFVASDGKTYEVTIAYGPEAGIPAGAELIVSELSEDGEEYQDYLEQTADAVGTAADALNYLKILDISIMNGEEKVVIQAPVDVQIKLLDKDNTEETGEKTKVVHFGESETDVIDPELNGITVNFEATGFSYYAVTTYGATSDLDGKSYAIVQVNTQATEDQSTGNNTVYAGRALTTSASNQNTRLAGATVTVETHESGLNLVSSGTTQIVEWEFESAGGANTYYIKAPNGQYLTLNGTALALSNTPQALTVTAGSGTTAGKVRISYGNRRVQSSVSAAAARTASNTQYFYNGNSNDANYVYLTLCEIEEFDPNQYPVYSGEKISVQDLVDGQKYILYKNIYNEMTEQYEDWVIDGNGNPVRAYDQGDSLSLHSEISPMWTLSILVNSAGQPTGYYIFRNEETGLILHPMADGTLVKEYDAATSPTQDGVSLKGREGGDYTSTIEYWDGSAMAYYGYQFTTDGEVVLSSGTGNNSQAFSFAEEKTTQTGLHTVATVDSAAAGVTIRMFNYPNRTTIANVTGSDSYGVGVLPAQHVRSTLVNGYPVFTNGNSGSTLFAPSSTYYQGTGNHLFLESVYDSTGYYEYSAFNNFAHYNSNDGTFTVYQETGTPNPTASNFFYRRGNFFPYNSLNTNNSSQNIYTGDGTLIDYENPNYGSTLYGLSGTTDYYFGMTMDFNFLMPKDGYEKGNPLIYEFNGDDDLWIYIDGVLILDIGGVHDAFPGTINFATGEIIGGNGGAGGATTIKECFENAGVFPDGTTWDDSKVDEYFNGDTFVSYGSHQFNMFYMEHGAGASNLQTRFNLPVIEKGKVTVEKQLDNTSQVDYANVSFAYQAFAKDEHGAYQPLTSAVYEGTDTPLTFYNNVMIGENGPYDNVFYLKPREAAVFSDMIEDELYYVQEIGIKTDYYDEVLVNDVRIEGEQVIEEEGIYKSTEATARNRARVTFTNKLNEKNSNELRITKRLAEGSVDNGDTFEFRVMLENASGVLSAYYQGTYYIRDDDGVYYRYEGGNLVPNGQTPYACTAGNYGTIAQIPPDFTVVIKDLVSDTDFYVDEIRVRPNGSSSDVLIGESDWTLVSTDVTDAAEGEITDADIYDYATGTTIQGSSMGRIELEKDAQVVFTNKMASVDVQLKKVKEDGTTTISGSVFDLNKYSGSWTSIQTDIKPGEAATDTTPAVPNPVDLGELTIGRYRLTETKSPDGYIILTKHVYFEVYKDTDGDLKARLTDEAGTAVDSPTDVAAIDGPGTGDTPTYTVTITNTPGAVLPNTGGSGTLPYTLGGIALIMASALMYGFRMRRRERRLN